MLIFHVDMDAFYTSVEQRDHPEIRGKPVIVGADPNGGAGRGVVAASSYEARQFGVYSAMPIGRAYRLCPQGVYLRGSMKKYSAVSKTIMSILRSYSDRVEPLSIDEAFVDVSVICRPEKAKLLAQEVKENIFQQVRLKASIGAAPNKFLAKIASDLEKPDGLVVVAPGEELDFLGPLPVERIWGVGPKTAERLHERGCRTIRDLWRIEPGGLPMGKHGDHILKLSRGVDAREVIPHHEAKSIGHETTFLEDTDDPEVMRTTLLSLAEAVATRLRKHDVRGKTVTLKFRDADFVTEMRSRTLPEPTCDAKEIFDVAMAQVERVRGKGKKIRLLGISLSKLEKPGAARQLSLFGRAGAETKHDRTHRLSLAQDRLEERFGKGSVKRASLIDARPIDRES